MRFFLLLSFAIIGFTLDSSGMSSVLIVHERVTPEEYRAFFNSRRDLISYIDYTTAHGGAVGRDLIQAVDDLKSTPESLSKTRTIEPLMTELTSKPLTPIRKRLLASLLEYSLIEKNLLELQRQTFEKHPAALNGSLPLPFKLARDDDQLFINGFSIRSDELAQIRLYPKIHYHIAYLSNSQIPSYQWVLGENIQALQKNNLVSGNCEMPQLAPNVFLDKALVLFPNSCLGRTQTPTGNTLGTNTPPPLDPPPSTESYWQKNRVWAIGGSLLLIGTLLYEVHKNYEISITVPF